MSKNTSVQKRTPGSLHPAGSPSHRKHRSIGCLSGDAEPAGCSEPGVRFWTEVFLLIKSWVVHPVADPVRSTLDFHWHVIYCTRQRIADRERLISCQPHFLRADSDFQH